LLGLVAVGYWRYVNYVPTFVAPAVRMPVPNGYDRAAHLLAKLDHASRPKRPEEWPDGSAAQLRAQLKPVQPLLDEMRACFRLPWRAPQWVQPRSAIPNHGFDSNLVIYQGAEEDFLFQEYAKCFLAEANLAARRGDAAAAMRHALDAMELGSKVACGSSAMDTWWTWGACHDTGFPMAEGLVATLPAGALPTALQRVRQVRTGWPSFTAFLENSRIKSLGIITWSLRDTPIRPPWQQFSAMIDSAQDGSVWKYLRSALTPRRVILAHIDDQFRRRIVESRKPFRARRVPVPSNDEVAALVSTLELDDPWEWERAKTQLALLEVALAVRLSRLQRGGYPERLDEIDPRWLPSVPRDCWDQPLCYRLKNGQPLIYSLGPDGKDDGGQVADPTQLTPQTRSDLVFGQLSHRLP
jgi:hypothetical protein